MNRMLQKYGKCAAEKLASLTIYFDLLPTGVLCRVRYLPENSGAGRILSVCGPRSIPEGAYPHILKMRGFR